MLQGPHAHYAVQNGAQIMPVIEKGKRKLVLQLGPCLSQCMLLLSPYKVAFPADSKVHTDLRTYVPSSALSYVPRDHFTWLVLKHEGC